MTLDVALAYPVQVTLIDKSNSVPDFKHVYQFARPNQPYTSRAISETLDIIRDFLIEQSVDYGLIIKLDGFYILTQYALDIDPLCFKLKTGVNFVGRSEVPYELVYTTKFALRK